MGEAVSGGGDPGSGGAVRGAERAPAHTNPHAGGREQGGMVRRGVTHLLLFGVLAGLLLAGWSGSAGERASEPVEVSLPGPAAAATDYYDCSGYGAWEAFIPYTSAHFDLAFSENGTSAQLNGQAWINGSLASTVRTSLDALFEGLTGGNNSWISTTERDATRNIAPDCIADTPTRIGLANGHHNASAPWGNLTWIQDDMGLDEVNMVPLDHPQVRSCGWPCKEVPVSITDDMQVLLDALLDGPGALTPGNSTLTIGGGPTSRWTVTFPAWDDLRVLDAPGLDVVQRVVQVDGVDRLQVTFQAINGTLHLNLTDEVLVLDDPPTWTEEAPADGAIIPLAPGNGVRPWLGAAAFEGWGEDDGGVAVLNCTVTDGDWLLAMGPGSLFSLLPNQSTSAEVTCEILDAAHQSSESRTFTALVPFTIDTTAGDVNATGAAQIAFHPDLTAPVLTAQVTRDGVAMGLNVTQSADGTLSVPTLTASPGPLSLRISLTADGLVPFAMTLDPGWNRSNALPTLTIEQIGFNDEGRLEVSGRFADPEGQDLTGRLSVDGAVGGTIELDGNRWSTTVDLSLWGFGEHEVAIELCDPHGGCATVHENVTLSADDALPDVTNGRSAEDTGLPAPGLGLTLLAMLAGLLVVGLQRRRA